jgi:hypothetical protein
MEQNLDMGHDRQLHMNGSRDEVFKEYGSKDEKGK